MMIRVGSELLDFNAPIEMERRVKLFEAIDETQGDFSYSFEMDRTANNMRILGYPFSDVADKRIYRSLEADLLDDSGIAIYKGVLRVDRFSSTEIECSFFSGNYNWIGALSGNLTEIDFSYLDTDLSEDEIINNGVNTEGIFFPIIDTGGLITRGSANLVLQDFTGMIFLKTAFEKIFQSVGIKISGDLMKDPLYNTMLVSRLTVDQASIDNRSTYANKTEDQIYLLGPPFSTLPLVDRIDFEDDSSFPFFDGSENNYASSTYTADVDMDLNIEVSIKASYENSAASAGDVFEIKIYVDGIAVYTSRFTPPPPAPDFATLSLKRSLRVDAGSYVEVFCYVDPAVLPIPPDLAGVRFLSDSTIRITPTFIYRVFGNSLLPKWTKAKFVNSVLSLFCCICDYEPVSKLLTIDLFEKIKGKESVDISQYIEIQETDTSEFLSNFFKNNTLKYDDSDAEPIKEYNIKYSEPYAAGVIPIDNAFLPASGAILENDFKAPVSYINTVFSASLERVNFVEMEELDSVDFTSITSSSGLTRLNMDSAQAFSRLQICRISNCTVPEYNGDWLILTVSTNFIVIDRPFSSDAKGTVTRLSHRYTNVDDVHLFIAVTYDDDNVPRFSNNPSYKLVENTYSNISYAFFNLLNTGRPINSDYTQGLALGVVNNVISYQRTLLDTYWSLVARVLTDPVKQIAVGNIPKTVYSNITPLKTVRLSTIETSNQYYLNLIQGYQGSEYQCTLELIKIS